MLRNFNPEAEVLIDGRDSAKFVGGHIENAIYIDAFSDCALDGLKQHLAKKQIFLYCTTNNRAEIILKMLIELGYKSSVVFLTDGIVAWKESSFDLIIED